MKELCKDGKKLPCNNETNKVKQETANSLDEPLCRIYWQVDKEHSN